MATVNSRFDIKKKATTDEYRINPSLQDSDELSSVGSPVSINLSYLNNAEINYSTDSTGFDKLSPRNNQKKIEEELNTIRLQVIKTEQELSRETHKLNSNNLQMERNGINLIEWENLMNSKLIQIKKYVETFKQNVHYSNEFQLNKQLVSRIIISDLVLLKC